MSDIVRLPGGKVITRSRAQALGMLDDAGNLKPDQAPDSAGARIIETDRKAAEWAKRQGLPAPAARVSSADVATTSDGLIKPVAKIEPLKPSNVDASGATITDEATLAAIAAQAAAVEAAAAAGTELTPAQKRAATMAINKAAKEAAIAEAQAAIDAEAAAAAAAAETPAAIDPDSTENPGTGDGQEGAAEAIAAGEAAEVEDITGGPDNGDGTGLSGDAAEVGGTTDETPAEESVSDEATEGQA